MNVARQKVKWGKCCVVKIKKGWRNIKNMIDHHDHIHYTVSFYWCIWKSRNKNPGPSPEECIARLIQNKERYWCCRFTFNDPAVWNYNYGWSIESTLTPCTEGCRLRAFFYFLIRSFTSTITCINWFPVRINENDRVIKSCSGNFPKDNILYSTFKVIHSLLKWSWSIFVLLSS